MNNHDKIDLPPNPITPMMATLIDKASGAGTAETICQLMQEFANQAIEADRHRRGEPVSEEELLAAREALIDMGYLWDGDQWVDVDPPSKTAEQAPEWPDFARMEASLQRLKERLVFENGRRKDLEQRLREKRNG